MTDRDWLAQLRQFRQDNDLTQHDLASFLGVSQRSISRWEAGTDLPSPDVQRRLAALLEPGLGRGVSTIVDAVRAAPVPLALVDGDGNLLVASASFNAVGRAIKYSDSGTGPASTCTVLVVEDDEGVLKATRAALKSWNFLPVGAIDGNVAVRLVSQGVVRPSAVIIDFLLPGARDGVDTAHELRRLIADLPVLIISGEVTPQRMRKISKSGFSFIAKPVDPEQIRLALMALLQPANS